MNAIATAIPGYNSLKRVAYAVAGMVMDPIKSDNVTAAVRKGVVNTALVFTFKLILRRDKKKKKKGKIFYCSRV